MGYKKVIFAISLVLAVGLIVAGCGTTTVKTGAMLDSGTGISKLNGDFQVSNDIQADGDMNVVGETHVNTLVRGGSVADATSSMTNAFSLTAAQVCDNAVITVNTYATAALTKAAASLNVTLPATSTLFADCLATTGDSVSFLFVNASPTAASTTELVAGTGCDDQQDVSGGDANVAGLGTALVTITRTTDMFGVNGTEDCVVSIHEQTD